MRSHQKYFLHLVNIDLTLTRIIHLILAIVMFLRVNPDLVESIFECQKWVRNFVVLNYFAICDE